MIMKYEEMEKMKCIKVIHSAYTEFNKRRKRKIYFFFR